MQVAELSFKECEAELMTAQFGRLGCARDDQPYVVPISFVVADGYVYSFSLPGKKLNLMRANPRVCLQIDTVIGADDWTSVVVVGHFEELSDTLELRSERRRAHALLRSRPMWWEPGATPCEGSAGVAGAPIYYRISMDHVSGRRGIPAQPRSV
jgi:uncharacterized protein